MFRGARILAIARRLYGDDTCRLIFEPLVADRDEELRRRSLSMRVRWYGAIVSTFVACAPKAAFGGLRSRFVLDLVVRAAAFFALAFALQWGLGAGRVRPHGSVHAWPPSFTTTFLFMLTPMIWRVRAEAIPAHQQRLLTFALATACLIAAGLSAQPGWPMALALLLGTVWLTVSSWKIYASEPVRRSPTGPWARAVYPGLAIIVAAVPIKLALGIMPWQPWWPGDSLIAYLVGAAIGLTSGLPLGEAGYRKLFNDPTSIFRR
jgi:hypothetical protein